VDVDRGESVVGEQLVEDLGTRDALDEHDALVELEVIQEIEQLAVLLILLQLDVVLLQTMEGNLGTIVDKDLQRLRRERERERDNEFHSTCK